MMKNDKKDRLFKTGIWIKEQQGQLTIGTLDKNNPEVMVIPNELSQKIFEFEKDMIEALYGENRASFLPDVINVEKLLDSLKKKFNDHELRISYSGAAGNSFKGSYNEIYRIIERFIQSSLSPSPEPREPLIIYINASVLQDHLCIIYRDSLSKSDPMKLKKEFAYIKTTLKGEITHKATSGSKSYYDIIIPSK